MWSNNSSEVIITVSPLYWIIGTTICPASIILYCLILYVIRKFPADFKNPYFTIIIGLSIADIVALLYAIHSFICCLTGSNYLGITIDKVFTFLYAAIGWYGGLHLVMLITINRLVAITMYLRYTSIFTVKVAKILVFIGITLAVLPSIPYPIVGTNIFIIARISPGFVEINQGTENVLFMDLIYGTAIGVVVISTHIICGILCIIKRRGMTSIKAAYTQEIKLLLQGTFIGSMLVVNTVTTFFPIGELSWVIGVILVSGLNPVVYVITDSNLRQHISVIFKKEKVHVISDVQLFTATGKANSSM